MVLLDVKVKYARVIHMSVSLWPRSQEQGYGKVGPGGLTTWSAQDDPEPTVISCSFAYSKQEKSHAANTCLIPD